MNKDYVWVEMYQYEGIEIEKLLEACLQKFQKKYNRMPKTIYVHRAISLKTFQEVFVRQDCYIYSKGMVGLEV